MPGPTPHTMLAALLREGSRAAVWQQSTTAAAAAGSRLLQGLDGAEALRGDPLAALLTAPLAAGESVLAAVLGALEQGHEAVAAEATDPRPSRAAPSQPAVASRRSAAAPPMRPPPRAPAAPPGPISAARAETDLLRRAIAAGADKALQQPVRGAAGQRGLGGIAATLGQMGGISAVLGTLVDGTAAHGKAAHGKAAPSPIGAGVFGGLPPGSVERQLGRLLELLTAGAVTRAARAGAAGAAAGGAGTAAMPRVPAAVNEAAACQSQGAPAVAAAAIWDRLAHAVQPGDAAATGGAGSGGFRGLAARAAQAATAAIASAAPQPAGPGTVASPVAGAAPAAAEAAGASDSRVRAAAPDDDRLAAQLARVLRREAERDGIDVDDVQP